MLIPIPHGHSYHRDTGDTGDTDGSRLGQFVVESKAAVALNQLHGRGTNHMNRQVISFPA